MSRWRDVKNGKLKDTKKVIMDTLPTFVCAPILSRVKAFITDMFMLMMPIMYITTYIIMNGKDDFQSSEIARWITMLVFGLITVLFWVKKGQTPGFKAYNLKLINSTTKQTISFSKATIRYLMFIVSAVSIVGALLPFIRKDKKTFQDLITNTCVIVDDTK